VNDFLFVRAQMGMSLGFHIIFAALGNRLPVLMHQRAVALREGG
jgi:hypothetical protein